MQTGFKTFLIILLFLMVMPSCKSGPAKDDPLNVTHKVLFETSEGSFTVAIYGNGMPETARNFIQYVKDGFYNGLIFHRVVKGFVIQGGGFNEEMVQKETRSPVKLEMPPLGEVEDESGKKVVKPLFSHEKYAVSMARTREVNSATSQFFITLARTAQLDPKQGAGPNGYAVFGKVEQGFEVIDKIGAKPVTDKNGHQNVPVEPVKIIKASVVFDSTVKESK